MFGRPKKDNFAEGSKAPQYLIVGLGNPGVKYELTRHNIGFMFVDRLADRLGFKVNKLKFKSLLTDVEISGVRCLVMKPETFMNNSGEAVRDAINFYKIPPEHIIVVFDDVSLKAGTLRIRKKGTDGGHNGIKSIIYQIGIDQFARIKVGIGPKPYPDMDLAEFVLAKIKGDDEIAIASAIDRAVDAVQVMVTGDIDKAMNLYNG